MQDYEYMKLALELAKKGIGYTSPNPIVGAVIVKNGKIIGEGYHEKYGEAHAERNAIANCVENPKGADIYITLEPCCHQGKQPPCVNAIIEAGIKKVIIGSNDPNKLVLGKGIKTLKEHGIEVVTNVLKDECDKLNEVFFHYISTQIPFVVMKFAMTLDGKIATSTGKSKWISCEESRNHAHALRHKYSSIMVGVGTILADNPTLNCRIENGVNPTRIICDTNLRTPLDCKIVSTAKEIPTIIATCSNDEIKHSRYISSGCEILVCESKNGHVDLENLMKNLGKMAIDSILIEGGGQIHWSAIESKIVQKAIAYIAPKIVGGNSAVTPVGGSGFAELSDAVKLENIVISQLGDDILVEGDVSKCLLEL